ncbi:MAG: ATP-grasp domain-containing protein [Acutalibacteraceae bacterium]
MEFREECFLPVIIGADINAYSLARSFHEEYKIKSLVISMLEAKIISKSKIIENRIYKGLENEDVLIKTLMDIGEEFKGKKKLIVLGCGDWYVRILVENKKKLEKYYIVPYINVDLLNEIVLKDKFYEICDKLDIPYPDTFVYNCKQENTLDFDYDYPIIAKPANSALYHYAKFPGKKKVFRLKSREELDTMLKNLESSSYDYKFLIQDCIPGGDDKMRVLNCYCDRNAKVKFASLGHVLLEEHTPSAIGNPVVVINEVNKEIVKAATKFLEEIGYTGYANFDIKYDERDGIFKFFEINVRLGRCNYYVTGSGFNTVKRIVDDLVFEKELDYEIADNENLFSVVPMGVIKKYVKDPDMIKRAIDLDKKGKRCHPLIYKGDMSPVRAFYVYAQLLNYYRKYKKYK